MMLFPDPPDPPPPAVPAPPALSAGRRQAAVAWLRNRLAVMRAFRREDDPLAGPVGYADAVRAVQGRKDLADHGPEFIAEAFRGVI